MNTLHNRCLTHAMTLTSTVEISTNINTRLLPKGPFRRYNFCLRLSHAISGARAARVMQKVAHNSCHSTLPIERFHSRDYRPYWFTETKESICIKIEFNSQRFSLGHQHGLHFFVLGHQHGRRDVMRKHSIPTMS